MDPGSEEDEGWIDGDPCINCLSTHTEGAGDPGNDTLVVCLTCGARFDVDGAAYNNRFLLGSGPG